MCKPGMAEWAWMRNIALKEIKKEADVLFSTDCKEKHEFIQNEISKFDSGRIEHDQMINNAIGGPGHSTL